MAKAIKTLDERAVTLLLKRFNKMTSDFAKEYGLESKQAAKAIADLKLGTVSVAMEFAIPLTDKDGKVIGAPAKNWNEYAATLGLKKDWLGRKVVSKGRTLTVVGMNPRKKLKPVMLVDDKGTTLVASAESIINYLEKADAARAVKAAKEAPAKKKPAPSIKAKKPATLAQGVAVVIGKTYGDPKGNLVSLEKVREGRVFMWEIRTVAAGSNTSKTYGTYGRAAGEGADDRRKFAEQQLRKLAAGVKGAKKALSANYAN